MNIPVQDLDRVVLREEMPIRLGHGIFRAREDRRLIHVNPNVEVAISAKELIVLVLLCPVVSAAFVEEVDPYTLSWPALPYERDHVLTLHKDACSHRAICVDDSLEAFATHVYVVEWALL
jgi:hypothetical protein